MKRGSAAASVVETRPGVQERVEAGRDVRARIRDRLERVERRAAGERREHCEHVRRRRAEQPDAPVDRRAQRALALGQVRRRPREERERFPEPLSRALDTEDPHARRGQLDREREPVERPGDPHDGGRVLRRELELRHRFPRPVDVEPDRRGGGDRVRGRPPRRPAPQRRDPVLALERDVERAAAGREHRSRGAASSSAAIGGERSWRCSRLSSTSDRGSVREPRAIASSGALVLALLDPERRCDASGARAPGRRPARGRRTAHRRLAAAASASVVLPVPPGPVSVTSRVSSRPSERRHRRQLELARPTSTGSGTGPAVGSAHARRGREGGIVLEDPALEGAELRRRLEPELVERRARVAVGVERVCLPAGAVQGEHQLAAEPLAMRMRGDERLELAHEGGVPPVLEIGVDPRFEGGEPALVEPRRLRPRERRVRDVRERRAAPERERLVGAPPDARARCSNRSTSSSPASTRTR